MFQQKPLEINNRAVSIKIEADCGEDVLGRWHCIECNQTFENNFGALAHDKQFSKHKIVWWCGRHGFEVSGHEIA